MKKKYSDLNIFITQANQLLNPETKTKFTYALEKTIARIRAATKKAETEYSDSIQDARIDFASVDKDQNLIMDGNNYRFTKENLKKLTAEIRKLTEKLNNTEFEIEPHFAQPTEELSEDQIETFDGLVIENKESINQNHQ